MSDNKDSGVGGLVGAGAVGAGVGYFGAQQASKGFVDKVLKGTPTKNYKPEQAAKDAIKDMSDEGKKAVIKASEEKHPAYKTGEVKAPDVLKGEFLDKVKKGATALKDVKADDVSEIVVKPNLTGPKNNKVQNGFKIEVKVGKGDKAVTHLMYAAEGTEGLAAGKITDAKAIKAALEEKGPITRAVAEINKIGTPEIPASAPSMRQVQEHGAALKDAKVENIGKKSKIHRVTTKVDGKDVHSYFAEIEHIADKDKPTKTVNRLIPLGDKVPEGIKFDKANTVVLNSDELRGAIVKDNFLGKAASSGERSAMDAIRKGSNAMKNMGAGRMAIVGAATVASAFVAKVAFDAMFGSRDNGYAAQISAERNAPVAEPAR